MSEARMHPGQSIDRGSGKCRTLVAITSFTHNQGQVLLGFAPLATHRLRLSYEHSCPLCPLIHTMIPVVNSFPTVHVKY